MIQKLTILTSLALLVGATWIGSALAADPADDLIGYWKLDGDTLDASGLENHGTAVGDPVFEAGMFKEALYFDGDGDYLVMDPVADDFTGNDLTLSAWIKTADTRDWQWWFSCNTASGGNVIILGLITGNIVVHQGAVQITSTAVVNDLEWYHVAYSRIDSVGSLYIDGALEGTHTTTFTLSANDRWSIAQEWDSGTPGDFLDGTVDDVRIYDRGLTEEELPLIMTTVPPGAASEPIPADKAVDVLRDVVLTWTPGKFAPAANGHTVYLSENFNDVNDGIGGVTTSDNAYTPPQRLAFATTYYWRVDEVNATPDHTVFPGEVWSFTVEPGAYAIENIIATSDIDPDGDAVPENTVNGSGLDENDGHSDDSSDMWLVVPAAGETPYIQYEFDRTYKLYELLVWNHNGEAEAILGFGLKDVTIEYSEDGVNWTVLADVTLNQATGLTGYEANTTVDFGGVAARYVRLTANSAYGAFGRYGLSEVRFLYTPVQARGPEPADGATDVSIDDALSWRSGREAASHEVYLGADPNALEQIDTTSTATTDPGTLDLGATYYWRVDEVNTAEAIGAWEGATWSFTTKQYLVIDDFESYTDDMDAAETIFDTWVDGYGINENGSTVGNFNPPFAERTVVLNGKQSMIMAYNNVGTSYAEATAEVADLAVDTDWTKGSATALVLWVHGALSNAAADELYLMINNTKVVYDGGLTTPIWKQWVVDLAGINISHVTSLTLGVDGSSAGVLYVDDIALYREVPAVAAPGPDSDPSLVGYWKLDETEGLIAADSSGYGNDGALIGMDGTEWTTGVVGGGLGFSGSQYIDCGNDTSLQLFDSVTISAWVKMAPNNTDVYMGVGGKLKTDPYKGFSLVRHNSNVFRLWADNGADVIAGYDASSDEICTDTEWHHLAGVVDDGTSTLYVDGVAQAKQGIVDLTDCGLPAHIGRQYSNSDDRYWDGIIDEFRIYYRALSAQEIAAL